MNLTSGHKSSAAPDPRRPVQDEWGLFDPEQAGIPALMRSLRDAQPQPAAPRPEAVARPAQVPLTTACPACGDLLPAGVQQCPTCLGDVEQRGAERAGTGTEPASAGRGTAGAVYTLESPVHCPQCESEIRTLRVLRVLRTQVSFTSTLPRKGYVIVCPDCERMLSAELSGLI
jgi:hypothetical protein